MIKRFEAYSTITKDQKCVLDKFFQPTNSTAQF